MLTNTNDGYGVISKLLHWLIAIAIIALLGVGIYMTGLDDEDPARRAIYGLHKATGMLVLMLVFLRFIWIHISRPPGLPDSIKDWERKLAKTVKVLLYILMFLVPISGYTMSTAGGYPVIFYDLFTFPALFEKNKELGEIAHEAHEIMAFTLLFLVILHIAGAIKHRIFDRDHADVLKRMT